MQSSAASVSSPSRAEGITVLERLDRVRRERAPYRDLGRALLARVFDQYVPEDGPLVEIGAGEGHFRDRLPRPALRRMTHTEPLAPAVARARAAWPEGTFMVASAERLPFRDGAVASVFGSCVMDVVSDGAEVASELQRVLRPGGTFVHWLDMSTRLNDVFSLLLDAGLVPLPNVFGDPTASRWPEDLFLAALADLTLVVSVLASREHPLAAPLGEYLNRLRTPGSTSRALTEYVQLSESAELRSALKHLFRAAFDLATPEIRERLARFKGRPVSSAKFLESRLRQWFGPESGFEVVASEVASVFEIVSAERGSPYRYTSLCVGEQRELSGLPEALLCPDATTPRENELLRELGVFVFVARRI
jgi:SAM-dependent methyltransferase